MARDRAIGSALVVGAVVGVIVYGFLLFYFPSPIPVDTLKITAFVAIVAVLAILGWIGYVMATTPPPVPLEPEPAPSAATASTSDAGAGTTEKKL
ncbi:MAG TPA: hypothetical protein VED17_03735 [Nitrososphaerales archaeon]|nr:hypothetical protein [Nitrososphaerales archaeon]